MDSDTNDQRTIWCGNLSEKLTEEILYELFLQAGPIQRVSIPKDREGRPLSYGFVTFKHESSVQYATQLLNGISLFERRINLKPRTARHEPKQENVNPIPLNVLLNPNELNAIMQMGSHMLIPNNCNQNERNSPCWERNRNYHREERRRDDKPYRNNYRGNNYYGNRQHGHYDHERNRRYR